VAVWEAIAGWDALIAKAGLLKLERLAREAELEVRCAVEVGPDILQILLEVLSVNGTAAILRFNLRPAGPGWVSVRRARQDSNL